MYNLSSLRSFTMSLNSKVTKYIPSTSKSGAEVSIGIGLEISDVEQLSMNAIINELANPNYSFVSVTTKAPQNIKALNEYELYTEEDLIHARLAEARKAANLGSYNSSFLLNYNDETIVDSQKVISDYAEIISAYKPKAVYTFSPFELSKQRIHVLKLVVKTILQLPEDKRPEHLYCVSLNNDLDVVVEDDVATEFDFGNRYTLIDGILSVYDSVLQSNENLVVGYKAIDLMKYIKENSNFSLKTFVENKLELYKKELLEQY